MKTELQPIINLQGNELIIRKGAALMEFPPRKVDLSGNIFAPGEFLFKRKDSVDITANPDHIHVVVDVEGLSITLCIDEREEFATFIRGKLEYFKEFLDFGINRNKQYTVSGLYKMLRLKRAYFKNRDAHASLLDQLKKFEASTEIEFKSTNDFKGSTALQKIEKCKTNLIYNFMLEIEIFKGLKPVSFPVDIEFEPNDGSIMCWLISEDLAEMEIMLRDGIMDDEIKKFEKYPIIKK